MKVPSIDNPHTANATVCAIVKSLNISGWVDASTKANLALDNPKESDKFATLCLKIENVLKFNPIELNSLCYLIS